jgi:hypothetical protein
MSTPNQPVKTIRRVVREKLKFRTFVVDPEGDGYGENFDMVRSGDRHWYVSPELTRGLDVADYELEAIETLLKQASLLSPIDLQLEFDGYFILIQDTAKTNLFTIDAKWPEYINSAGDQFTRITAQQTNLGWLIYSDNRSAIFIKQWEIKGYLALFEKAKQYLAEQDESK